VLVVFSFPNEFQFLLIVHMRYRVAARNES
jgi:hypothetical protein